MLIGIGSGRCGTLSLAKLFGGVHELRPILPWKRDEKLWRQHRAKMTGDMYVAYYYLPYIQDLLDEGHTVICLKRNKEDTIRSFNRKLGKDFFKKKRGVWRKSFPDVDNTEDYYDLYYDIANKIEHPNFRIFNMQALQLTHQLENWTGKKTYPLKKIYNALCSDDDNLS